MCFLLLALVEAVAQSKTITGIVTDQQKESLPGVSVRIKSSTIGTATDLDGKYSIEAKVGDVIEYSFIGMKPQSRTVNATSKIIDVILTDDSEMISEVVVVGYGSAKKADLTGSIASVSSSDILKQPSGNAMQSVQGKVAGVNITASDAPGSNPNISVRGLGTALGGRDPLYIVDGFPVDNISTISPSDILSMNVLKDASSASIYGLRAANGVVMITTKKGQSGAPKISFDSYVGIKSAMNKVKMANASQYITYFNENQDMLKAYGNENTFHLADANSQPYNTDWYDELLKTGFYNNNTVSVSGGGQAVDYFLSYNYYNEKGILDDQTYQRSTIRNNNTYKFYDDRLKISQNLNISFTNEKPKPYGAFNNAYRQSPLVPVTYASGLYGLPYASKETGLMWTKDGDAADAKINSIGNPLYSANSYNQRNETFTLQGGFEGEFKITDYLKANSRFGGTKYYYKHKIFTNTRANWINTKGVGKTDADFDAERNSTTANQVSPTYANNSLELKNIDTYRWTWEGFLTFNKSFDKHNIDAVAGLSREKFNIGSESVETGYNVPSKSQYWSMNHASSNYVKKVEGYDYTRTALSSYFGRVQYNYDHKYYLSATIRRDGSSQFKTGGKYWGTFPSFGLGWTMTQEEFMQNQKFLDYLKFRFTWGKLGNQNIPFNYTTYTVNPGDGAGNYPFGNQYNQGAAVGTPAKPLSWEITRETGFGFDLETLNNRLSVGFDYYDKLNTNAILQITPIPTSQYSEDYYDHVGKISNKGIEISLGWSDQLAMGLKYNIGVNYSYNKNEVKDLKPMYEGRTGGSLGDGQITKRLTNGQPVFAWWMYQADGVWQSQDEIDQAKANGEAIYGTPRPGYLKYKDVNGDGVIDNDDKVYAGSYIPKSNYGIHIGLEYKNVDFSIDGYGVGGNKIYNALKYGRIDGGENISYETYRDRWHGEGTSNTNPGAAREAIASTYYLESGNYFRINNITLGYTFKDLVFKGSSLRAYVTAQNPFMFTKYSGFSPEIVGTDPTSKETDQSAPNKTAGIELSAYPSTRNFLFGINLQF